MLKKFTVFLLSAALLLTLALFFTSKQSAAVSTDMLDTAAMLPDSDVVVTMDFDRTFNIAATNLLGQDAKKIEHLKNLMKTVENQIGINPYQVRQIAAGFKLPPQNSKDFLVEAEFTAIIRTSDSNANLLDTWSKRIDAIAAFKEEQAESRRYIDDFKNFRAFKFENSTPEKIAAATAQFQSALKVSQDIAAKLKALPKLAADAEAVTNLKNRNQSFADDLNEVLKTLQADTETKSLRETSIKLQNRWNAITLDDAQRTAKLAAVTKESKDIFPVFQKKYAAAKKLEALFATMEVAFDAEPTADNNEIFRTENGLEQTLESLNNLPATKAVKTAEINRLAENFDSMQNDLQRLSILSDGMTDATAPENSEVKKPKSLSFYDALKQSQRAETVNGKRMIVIDTAKMDDAADAKTPITDAKTEVEKNPMSNIAIGFIDDKTMVIGFEKTVAPFMKRDAGYKNQKVLEMLGTMQNALFAFVVNSKATGQMFAEFGKTAAPKTSESSLFDSLSKDVNIYGSVNFDGDKTTNDITMSFGFFKEVVSKISLPEIDAANNSNADSTFEFAGYQVGKDIFYDLFNSFKAVQASMTFKFEKNKVAALVRSAPRIIESVRTANSPAKKPIAKIQTAKANKLESVMDLLTAPQFYVDLAGLLKKGD